MKTTLVASMLLAVSACKSTGSSSNAAQLAGTGDSSNDEIELVPNAPYQTIVCGGPKCYPAGYDASVNRYIFFEMGADGQPAVERDASTLQPKLRILQHSIDYEYIHTPVTRKSFPNNKSTMACGDAVRIFKPDYVSTRYDGQTCTVLINARLEDQLTFSVLLSDPANANMQGPSVETFTPPAVAAGSHIGRDLGTVASEGHGVKELIVDMAKTFEAYPNFDFKLWPKQMAGCLENSRINANTDIQAFVYCSLPHNARRCIGSMVNAFKQYCPAKPESGAPAFVKTYAPDFRFAFNYCFRDSTRVKGFDYFVEPGQEWKAKVFLEAYDVIQNFRDFDLASENKVIKAAYVELGRPRPRRSLDNFPAWSGSHPRYAQLMQKQQENADKEKLFMQQLTNSRLPALPLDSVVPTCEPKWIQPYIDAGAPTGGD